MWLLPYLNVPRSDLKFAFSISAFIASFLEVSAADRDHGAVDQLSRVIGLGAVIGRPAGSGISCG